MFTMDSTFGKLAKDCLVAILRHPETNPEDYAHNAIVAIRQADAFVTRLHNYPESVSDRPKET